jgi:hypothetical protein
MTFFQLLTLYPQPVRMQSSGGAEYLPVSGEIHVKNASARFQGRFRA